MSRIYVLAGVNGAGKSSIGGEMFRARGTDYYNPDEAARVVMSATLNLEQAEANSIAWQQGRRLLERAIAERLDFVFETTLGGNTIALLLAQAAALGIEIHVWYVGLTDPDLHIARVRARVNKGGHAISETDIRRRFRDSRMNLVDLMPLLTSLRVYDNSYEADPDTGKAPLPQLILHLVRRKIIAHSKLPQTPDWAKPIVMAALNLVNR